MVRLGCILSAFLVVSCSALAQQSFVHDAEVGSLIADGVARGADVGRAAAAPDLKAMLHEAKTICIRSKTAFVSVETLRRALEMDAGWKRLGLTIVADPRMADVVVEVRRPLFAYTQRFVLADGHTSTVLGSGRVVAFDGDTASSSLATGIVQMVTSVGVPGRRSKL